MAFTNNIMIVRHKLLTELVRLWKNGELTTDKIDRLPLELSPRRSKHAGRCCVHKERAVWKYKSLPLLGLKVEVETADSLHYPNMPPKHSTVQKMGCPRTI